MSETRLTPEVDLKGMSTEEAFAALGDETRLDIMRTLWTAGALREYDDLDASAGTMSFSQLRRRVGVDDNGRFNYHLSKLTPHFVRGTDDGYRLTAAGKKITRTVIAVSGDPPPDVSDEVDTDCPVCGGPVTATYEDQWLRFACTECDGLFGDSVPEGTVLNAPFLPASVATHTSDDAFGAELYRCMLDLTYMLQGVCRECSSRVTGSVSVCDAHDPAPGGSCGTCGSPFPVWGKLQCDTCRFGKRLPIEVCVLGLPPVIAFLYGQDINVLAPTLDEIVDVLRTQVETAVTGDPFRLNATVDAGDDELRLLLDEELNVLEASS